MKRIFICLLGCTVMNSTIMAQDDSTKNRRSIEQLEPIEVRAVRSSYKSPFVFNNVKAKDIAIRNTGQNLPYLLGHTPSVVMSSDDGLGIGYTSMRLRGSDVTRINFTLNGIPVNDPESQNVFFVNMPDLASSTSSIQIQRGVGASTNGAGAFGATISLSNIEQKPTAGIQISSAYGSYNTWKNTIQAATGRLKNGFNVDIRLSQISSDGYIQRSLSDLKSLQALTGWTSANEKTNIKFNIIMGKERTGQAWTGIGTSFSMDDAANYDYKNQIETIGRRYNPLGLMSNGDYYKNQTDNYLQNYYQLFINQKINANWTANISGFLTRGKGYYEEYKEQDKLSKYGLYSQITIGDSIIKRANFVRQLWLDNYYYGSVFSANYQSPKNQISIGGAYTQYDAKHFGVLKYASFAYPVDYQYYHAPANKNDFNIYTKWQHHFNPQWIAYADAQVRILNYDIDGFKNNPTLIYKNDYQFFNPKLGVTYIINQNGASLSKAFASFAIANKEPVRDDFETASQNMPKHETVQDFEIGYAFENDRFSLELNGYYMNYKNQLILTGQINDVGAYARVNVPKSYKAGIELSTQYQCNKWLNANINAAFSRNKIKEFKQYTDNYDTGVQDIETFTNTDISFTPNFISGTTISFIPYQKEHRSFYIEYFDRYTARQYLDNSSNTLKSIDPYYIGNIRLRYEFKTPQFKQIQTILSINNLFNKKYENNGYSFSYTDGGKLYTENFYFPQAGTHFNLGVNLSL
ncbi:MAG: TonB-dependent receptor [Chitinophagaceae bacterium]|nr:MAG: TonB-dependent receptor [Chitinophagaceae bacterium]